MTIENEPFAYFVEVEPIAESSELFDDLEKKDYYYYYFQKNQMYFLFLYGKYGINLEAYLMMYLEIRKELNSKQRKIRSIRGFLLYALEVINYNEEFVKVLKTNFRPRFWTKVQDVIKQNKKGYLFNFLFGTYKSSSVSESVALETKYFELENQIQNMRHDIISLRESFNTLSSINLETNNQSKVKGQNGFGPIPKEDFVDLDQSSKKIFNKHFDPLSKEEQKYITKQFKELSMEEREEIISEGFKLFDQGLITQSEYFEGTDHPRSLFQTRKFCLKYNSIRKTPLFRTYSQIHNRRKT